MEQVMNNPRPDTQFHTTATDYKSLAGAATHRGGDHNDAGFALYLYPPLGQEQALAKVPQSDARLHVGEGSLNQRGRKQETPAATDFQLARSAAAGDQRAFEMLYRKHYQKVYAICLRMLRHPADAEDATQDVFVRVYDKIGLFQGSSEFTTWLYRLAVNSLLMNLRRKRRRQRDQPTDDGILEMWAEGRELWRHHDISIIDRIALKQAMVRLPAGYHRVLLLHDVEGFRHREIGQILGIRTGTSKSQLHKARAMMKKLLLAKPSPIRPVPNKTYCYATADVCSGS